MANDDDARRGGAVGGWSGMHKGVPMVMVPAAAPDPVASATRTAGNILVILLMLAAVLSAGFLFTLRWLWSEGGSQLTAEETPVREIVIYRDELQEAVEALQSGQRPEKVPTVPPLQHQVTELENEYATLLAATSIRPPPPPPKAGPRTPTRVNPPAPACPKLKGC